MPRTFRTRFRLPLRSAFAALVAAVMTGLAAPAWAQATVELRSGGGYQSLSLPTDVTEVELAEQLQGACRFNRTWGYDLTNRELWVNGGCGGKFKLVQPAAAEDSRSSNAAAAAVAVAAIAGIAILAHANRDRNDTPAPDYNYQRGKPIRTQSNMCLDVSGGNPRPGTLVQLYQCHGRENQRFSWGRGGELVTPGNLCLDVANANSGEGARLVVWNCSGAPNQRWTTRGNAIMSRMNGKCLDVLEGKFRNGQPVVMWSCNGGPNQRWWW